MQALRMGPALSQPSSVLTLSVLTLSEIVNSPEWELVERTMAAELRRYTSELTSLDPDDPQIAQKASVRAAKIRALRALNRKFYEDAGLLGPDGEARLTGGSV